MTVAQAVGKNHYIAPSPVLGVSTELGNYQRRRTGVSRTYPTGAKLQRLLPNW